jgi:CRP-like cAMP-binding protein
MSSLDMLLEGLPEAGRTDLFAALQSRRFDAGTRLIEQDAPSAGLFVIDGGTVRISLEEPDVSAQVCDLGPGEVVGEISLVEEGTTKARVTAQTDVRVRWLSPRAYDDLVEQFPELRLRLRQLAEERIASLREPG